MARTLALSVAALLGAVVVLFVVAKAFEPDRAVETAEPNSAAAPTIAAAAQGIEGVVRFEDVVLVSVQIDGTPGDENYVFRVGSVLQDVAAAIQAGATDAAADATELDLVVSSAATDRLGAARTVQVMSLTLPLSDLRAARLDALSVGRLLNLATDVSFTPAGAQQLAAYCAGERGRSQSRPFCALAEAKAGSA